MRTWRQCSLFLTALNDRKNAAFAIIKTKTDLKYAIKNTKFYITEEKKNVRRTKGTDRKKKDDREER